MTIGVRQLTLRRRRPRPADRVVVPPDPRVVLSGPLDPALELDGKPVQRAGERGGRQDGERTLDVHVVRCEDDRHLGRGALDPPPQLLERESRRRAVDEGRIAVWRNRAEDDRHCSARRRASSMIATASARLP